MFNEANKRRIESEYNVVNGIIQNPGRFENETWVTVLANDISMDGCADVILSYQEDGVGEYACMFNLDSDEQKYLNAYAVYFVQDEQGFCYTSLLDEELYNAYIAEYESLGDIESYE